MHGERLTQNSELTTQNAKGWRPDGSLMNRDIKGASPWLVRRWECADRPVEGDFCAGVFFLISWTAGDKCYLVVFTGRNELKKM